MQCKISSDINNLNKINKKYSWVPSELNIRPSSKIINTKNNFLKTIDTFYESYLDYIYSDIFEFKNEFNESGRIKVLKDNIYKKVIFQRNMFPYELPDGTQHYVLWYSYNENITEDLINEDIKLNIYNILNSNKFDFVWYDNPKKTVKDVFHVQVFWIELD